MIKATDEQAEDAGPQRRKTTYDHKVSKLRPDQNVVKLPHVLHDAKLHPSPE